MGRRGRESAKPKSLEQVSREDFDAAQDDIDAFNALDDKIDLDSDDANAAGDSDDEILALDSESDSDNSNDDDNDSDSDGDDDDDDGDGDGDDGGDSRHYKNPFVDLSAEEMPGSDEDDGGDGDDQENVRWGRRIESYYKTDADSDDDRSDYDDDLKANYIEEQEALRLQKKKLQMLETADIHPSMEDLIAQNQSKTTKSSSTTSKGVVRALADISADLDTLDVTAPAISQLQNDTKNLTKKEKQSLISRKHPEISSLLKSFQEASEILNLRLLPLMKAVENENNQNKKPFGDLAICVCETKTQLLSMFCANVSFYLSLVAQGASVSDHSVLAELYRIQKNIKSLKSLEKKLGLHIDELVEAAINNQPLPLMILEENDNESDAGVDVELPNDETTPQKKSKKDKKKKKDQAQKEMQKIRKYRNKEEEARRKEEMTLLTASKKANSNKNLQQTKQKPKAAATSDFSALDSYNELDTLPNEDLTENSKKNLEYEEALFAATNSANSIKLNSVSAELDVPREPFQKKKRKQENFRETPTKQQKQKTESQKRKRTDSESRNLDAINNPLFADLQALADDSKKKKFKKSGVVVTEETVEGRRQASYEIIKNRGLVKYRKREDSNPRVKNRRKFEKAIKKRRTMVQEVQKPTPVYGGESIAIKTRTVRSTKLR